MRISPSAAANAALFALLPALAAGGAMGLPVLLCLAATFSMRPSLLKQVSEKARTFIALLLILCTWAVISSAWSAHPGFEQGAKLAVLVPLGVIFVAAASGREDRALTRAMVPAAFAVLALLLAVEALWDLPLNRAANPEITERLEVARNVNRGATLLLAVSWGAAGAMLKANRPLAGAAIAAISGLLSLPFGMAAQIAAWLAGSACFLIALRFPRAVLLSVSSALAAWTLTAPFVTWLVASKTRLTETLPYSWAARVEIWDYVCRQVLERPWFGHGLDASRAVEDRIVVQGVEQNAVPLHPHSASLQIWFETGAVGALLAAGALLAGGWALSRAFRNNRAGAAAAAATLASLGLIANLSFGIWQEWWIATMFIAAAAVGALIDPRPLRG